MSISKRMQDGLKERGLEFVAGYAQNVVSTTSKQNVAAAKVCESFPKAVMLFRALQYANGMGTHGEHFDELREHFGEHVPKD